MRQKQKDQVEEEDKWEGSKSTRDGRRVTVFPTTDPSLPQSVQSCPQRTTGEKEGRQ